MNDNGKVPSYEEFFLGGRELSERTKFLKSLDPGIPALVEGASIASKYDKVYARIYGIARHHRIPVRFLSRDGKVWIVRLKPEDVKK